MLPHLSLSLVEHEVETLKGDGQVLGRDAGVQVYQGGVQVAVKAHRVDVQGRPLPRQDLKGRLYAVKGLAVCQVLEKRTNM